MNIWGGYYDYYLRKIYQFVRGEKLYQWLLLYVSLWICKMVHFLMIFFGRYERFLKIMILSVLKNTHRPVKFWFIKNYLSPQFKVNIATHYSFFPPFCFCFFSSFEHYFVLVPKTCALWWLKQDVIPLMAEEYGFDFELITYKWPTWLHKQKEKQRIIWAYKILFLDVIFPLSLEKVPCLWYAPNFHDFF